MSDDEVIAAQLRHAIDLLVAEQRRLEDTLKANKELYDHRLGQLEKVADDHEQRIRATSDAVTAQKTWISLISGGSGIMSIAAFIKTLLGA